ncbi:MAG: DUF5658 family protein [Planctomycetota bacterium]|jgi:hypothetical protein
MMLVAAKSRQADATEEKVSYISGREETTTIAVKSIEIDSGFVIFEGRYIPPPYIILSEQGKTFINGIEVPQTRRPPFQRRGFSIRHKMQMHSSQDGKRIEQHLRKDAMLIFKQKGPMVFVPTNQAICILDILLSDETQNTKVQRLLQASTPWITSVEWATLVEKFNAPVELYDRVEVLKQHLLELDENDTDASWYPRAFVSSITITGFILAVLALGILLGCRTPMIKGWRDINRSNHSCRQVINLVILIVILNIYDLICTLFAQGVGGLWELNPFACQMVERAPMIVTFKLALTIGAALMFLLTRYHRLAQIGSYWFGVLYTVLILRWITFNSLIL